MHKYSMAYLTGNGADPITATEVAAKAGYDMVSYRFFPAGPGDTPPPLLEDDKLFAETLACMKANGLGIIDVEMMRLAQGTDLQRFKPLMDRAAQLGATSIVTAIDDPDRARAIDAYCRLCEMAEPYGISAELEFMPWTGCKTIRDALEFMDATSSKSAAVLFDTLHFDRCGSTLDDISAIPADKINYVQLCDALADYDKSDEGLIYVARQARLIPGRGDIDFAPIMKRLPKDVPISVEIPDKPLVEEMGLEAFVRAALEETRALVDRIEAEA
jgi:sugar phosphate isomerase/epimerase